MRVAVIDFYKILSEEKSYEKILIYYISYKMFLDRKSIKQLGVLKTMMELNI